MDIPASVVYMGNWAFGGCSKLERVIYRGTNITVGVEAFKCCDKLKNVEVFNWYKGSDFSGKPLLKWS